MHYSTPFPFLYIFTCNYWNIFILCVHVRRSMCWLLVLLFCNFFCFSFSDMCWRSFYVNTHRSTSFYDCPMAFQEEMYLSSFCLLMDIRIISTFLLLQYQNISNFLCQCLSFLEFSTMPLPYECLINTCGIEQTGEFPRHVNFHSSLRWSIEISWRTTHIWTSQLEWNVKNMKESFKEVNED